MPNDSKHAKGDSISWQVAFFVLGGVGLFYSGGSLLYLLLGNPGAMDYRQIAGQRPYVNAIFFSLVAAFPVVIWSYIRDRRKGTHRAMPDRLAGMSYRFWGGVVILLAGVGGTLVGYYSVENSGGSYVVFVGLIAWGLVTMIRGLFSG